MLILILGNQLRFLPPEICECGPLSGNEGVVKMHDNPWVLPIADNLKLGVGHVFRWGQDGLKTVSLWEMSFLLHFSPANSSRMPT